ncbi:hypothetical protein P7D22_15100 [Lichenihabitans sp. Uapishka_5]|uniref:hypothetical protein n=1 Tax=Lichenihabitans sp. Uapishka_5 TaxID=3037302 RepID=UPI0029E80FB4|nr:hypothetical protein [Lichenihabitans sp. Uapishka_5]MDX7952495.1 hypothetical protein [Lichenihabitans sp. Uapishka_5]
MIVKLVTAILSALILSAVLGALPCEATGTMPKAEKKEWRDDARVASTVATLLRPTAAQGGDPAAEAL